VDNYIAIMAGGVGSRFWPASREKLPKQFLDILGIGKSLLRLTYERCLKMVPNDHVFIVTNKQYKALVQEHLPELPVQNILCEPSRNNTAPCVAYTALRIESLNPEAALAILPSDHVIIKEDEFVNAMNTAFSFAHDNNALLTLGIQPTRPDTGYGYIKMTDENPAKRIFKVDSFREKPDLETAKGYLKEGGYVWNAGIFIWSIKSILKSFHNNAPNILEILSSDKSMFGTAEEQDYIDRTYPNTESISVDYAILERSDNVYTIPVEMGWSDLGTWGSLYDMLSEKLEDNVVIGGAKMINSKNVLIKSKDDKLVIVKDLNDYIIIDEDDVLMIWPKKDEQAIKALRNDLAEEDGSEYL